LGLTLIAGFAGTGPGTIGGTVIFGALTPPVTVTGPNAPVTIDYNPPSYAAPTDFLPNFTLTGGATLTQFMLVFPSGTKVADGTTAVNPGRHSTPRRPPAPRTGVTLVPGPGRAANFGYGGRGDGHRHHLQRL